MSHSHSHITEGVQKTTKFSLLSTILLASAKWMAGIFGNSYALIADAIESTIDIFSSFAVFLGLKYAHKPADEDHPYGHGRIEPIITFFIVGLMLISATLIAYESIKNILTPHKLPENWTLLIVAGIIIWKETSYQIILSKSKKLKSSILRAEAWHHRSDAITSLAAFIGISLALILGKGYEYMDDIAAFIASFFIAYNAFKLFRPAWGEIMDENIYDQFVEELKAEAKLIPEIYQIEKCNVRKVGLYLYIDMHIEVDGNMTVRNGHEVSHQFKDIIMKKYSEVGDVLIHIEPAYENH